jgi:hypothetical protein
MPKLKLTYLQIKEQAARDIKNRTEARQAQLFRKTFFHKATQTEDFEETDSEDEDTEQQEFSYNAQLFFLVLLLVERQMQRNKDNE